MALYDTVLFDLDGTLTDSAEGILRSVDYALEHMGYPLVPEHQRRLYVGPPLLDSFQKLNGMTPEQSLEGVRLFRERYNKIGWMENRVYTGIPRMLRALKAQGVRLAVATATPGGFAELVIEYFGLMPYVDCRCAAPLAVCGRQQLLGHDAQ